MQTGSGIFGGRLEFARASKIIFPTWVHQLVTELPDDCWRITVETFGDSVVPQQHARDELVVEVQRPRGFVELRRVDADPATVGVDGPPVLVVDRIDERDDHAQAERFRGRDHLVQDQEQWLLNVDEIGTNFSLFTELVKNISRWYQRRS